MLHKFPKNINDSDIPDRFTYPFNYIPHKLSKIAAECARHFIENSLCSDSIIRCEIQHGKMFGVLVVKDNDEYKYLIGFSGNICHSNRYRGFVPPVYDILSGDDFFVKGEKKLNDINRSIEELESDDNLRILHEELARTRLEFNELRENHKRLLREAKQKRDLQRSLNPENQELLTKLIGESSFQKAQYKRDEQKLKNIIDNLSGQISLFEDDIQKLKSTRKELSYRLQREIFEHFEILNALGERKNLLQIFSDTLQLQPPAGAGECAAPKLLQYAYLNGLKPVCMAEFWWGDSPKEEIRVDGCFYPSCKSKCEPILNFMMQGLDVEPNPITLSNLTDKPTLLYEDDWLIAINKPSGMLSMRGKVSVPSVEEWLKLEYKNCNYMVVHRLDMDTSGVLLIAKELHVYRLLQGQFSHRLVKKWYKALVEKELLCVSGVIDLPLIADIDNRPFQKVDPIYGKESVTNYRVLSSLNGVSMVEFMPLTGRTHQIRVHAAHKDGLNAPIVGDNLYGKRSERLMLHAERVEFIHPITKNRVLIIAPMPFTL